MLPFPSARGGAAICPFDANGKLPKGERRKMERKWLVYDDLGLRIPPRIVFSRFVPVYVAV